MKKTTRAIAITLLLIISGFNAASAQGWKQLIDKKSYENPVQIEKTAYGYLILGQYLDSAATVEKYYLIGLDTLGQEIWFTEHTTPLPALVEGFAVLSTGEIIVKGLYAPQDTVPVTAQPFLAKHTALGAQLWYKQYPNVIRHYSRPHLMVLPGDTILLSGGHADGFSLGKFFFKLTNEGDSIQFDFFPFPFLPPGYFVSTVSLGHNNTIVTTDIHYTQTSDVVVNISGFDLDYNQLWMDSIQVAFPFSFEVNKIMPTTDGGYLLVGSKTRRSADYEDYPLAVKISATGSVEWEYIDMANIGQFVGVSQSPSGNYGLVGEMNPYTGNYAYNRTTGVTILSPNGQLLKEHSYTGPSISSFLWPKGMVNANDNGFLVCAQQYNAGLNKVDVILMRTDSLGYLYKSAITGTVFKDNNSNCQLDGGEARLKRWIVVATGNETYYAITDTNGNYTIPCAPGTYTISTQIPNNYWIDTLCPNTVTVATASDTAIANVAMGSVVDCPLMAVNVTASYLRACLPGAPFVVDYCNNGTDVATNAYVDVTLDSTMILDSASLAYTALGNDVYRFQVGTVEINECGVFQMYVRVRCGVYIENGQSYFCVTAQIEPSVDCLPIESAWDGARLELESVCNVDSLSFTVTNVGDDMATDKFYAIVQDDIMYATGTYILNNLEEFVVNVPANGATWTFITEQTPFFPGNKQLIKSVEACGRNSSGGFSTGFLEQFPQVGPDFNVSTRCFSAEEPVYAQKKDVLPKGIGRYGIVDNSQILTYRIFYSNFGTDTIHTIRIKDVLSDKLDVNTITNINNAYNADWELVQGQMLEITFDNINLPPCADNNYDCGVHFTFDIRIKDNQPWGTQITNTAKIFIDDELPIYTNTTINTVGDVLASIIDITETDDAENRITFFPNPTDGEVNLEIAGKVTEPVVIRVFDLRGKLIEEQTLPIGNTHKLQLQLVPGAYIFDIHSGGLPLGTGKLLTY